MGDQERHTRRDRLRRLRERLSDIKPPNATPQLVGVLKGLMDYLADELPAEER